MNYGVIFDISSQEKKLADLEDQLANDPDFWQKSTSSGDFLKNMKSLEKFTQATRSLQTLRQDLLAALELAREDLAFLAEATTMLQKLEELTGQLEIQHFLSHSLDHHDALLTIQAGAGGVESCDWASMLWRMYDRFSQKNQWSCTVIAEHPGDTAGVKSVECEISGEMAYGYLKGESGVHRLIRISPFDSGARRHTSFASVHVTALVDDSINIEILPKDLRIDTYRASGAGGQHVNKTDSAVRMTHLPSGIVVQSQSQRSQHQNKEKCMKLLKAKLYEWEEQKKNEQLSKGVQEKSDISFGSQIRTYTLHPFKLVKDHRSSYESSAPEDVLNGNLSDIIRAYLLKS